VNALVITVACVLVAAQLLVPKRLVLVPLLVATFHVPFVAVFPLNLSIIRIVLLTCLIRALTTGALVLRSRHPLDRWLMVWASVLLLTGLGHSEADGNPLTLRLGLIFEFGGAYLCAKAYLRNPADVVNFSKYLALVLVPLAGLMIFEKTTGESAYEALGATFHMIRDGRIRAAGPFANAILAGTAGATAVPLMWLLSREHRSISVLGAVACFAIVYSSASSGPFMTMFFALAVLALWRWRSLVPWIRRGAIACIVVLHLLMNDPVWYLMARIDITGGSVGYHRAELLTQAFDHIGEWWLIGTDYTRHWMPYGVQWSEHHADITNYYLKMGILGGLPLMFAFIAILVVAFRLLGRSIEALRTAGDPTEFVLWCVGVCLAALCFAYLGVAPYDQSYILLFSIIGCIPGLCAVPVATQEKQRTGQLRSESYLP